MTDIVKQIKEQAPQLIEQQGTIDMSHVSIKEKRVSSVLSGRQTIRYIIEMNNIINTFISDMRHIHPGAEKEYADFTHNELVKALEHFFYLFSQEPLAFVNAISDYPNRNNYEPISYPFLASNNSWELFSSYCSKLMGALVVKINNTLPPESDRLYKFERYARDHITVLSISDNIYS